MKRSLKMALPLLLWFNSAQALTPVIDAGAIAKLAKQLQEMQKQYKLMNNTYNNAKGQLDAAKVLNQFNSGHYKFGNLKNSAADLKEFQWSANHWDDALKNIAGGNKTRYDQLVKAYEKNHRTLPDSKLSRGLSQERFGQYKQSRSVNEAVSVQSTYAFDDINTHLTRIHELSQKIEETENTKSALDLNSRLIAEMAYIQVQTLKLQTLLSQQTAQFGANELDETVDSASFNRLPDESKE